MKKEYIRPTMKVMDTNDTELLCASGEVTGIDVSEDEEADNSATLSRENYFVRFLDEE